MVGNTPTDIILRAAEDVILGQGIGAMSLDAVAKRAGLSKSGLLHHFHSKDAMVDALVRRKVDRWREDYTAAIEAALASKDRLVFAVAQRQDGAPEPENLYTIGTVACPPHETMFTLVSRWPTTSLSINSRRLTGGMQKGPIAAGVRSTRNTPAGPSFAAFSLCA